MRYSRFFYTIFVMCLFFACSDNAKKGNKETVIDETVVEQVKYADKNFTKEAPNCTSPEACTSVKINFPEITGVPGGLDRALLNEHIKKAILKTSLDPEGKATDIPQACNKFIQDYAEFKKEMEQDVAAWSIEISISVINNDANYFSLRVDEYAYLGGAHPNHYTSFLNYQVATGKQITLEQLIRDKDRLEALAEKKFRETKDLPVDASLTEAGYFFDEGKFTLTENFGISQGNLLLYYNNYDIAPYVFGPTLLELPLETLL